MSVGAGKLTRNVFRVTYAQREHSHELLDGVAVHKSPSDRLHSILQFIFSVMVKELGYKTRPEWSWDTVTGGPIASRETFQEFGVSETPGQLCRLSRIPFGSQDSILPHNLAHIFSVTSEGLDKSRLVARRHLLRFVDYQ
jgi:hypothetical protein